MAPPCKRRAADFVLPAPRQPPRKKTTICISSIKPSPRLGLPYITHDLIPNILIHLPPRSVARFRLVCKDWLAMISHPDFVNTHLQASKQRPSLLMVPTRSEDGCDVLDSIGFYRYHLGEEAELMHLKELRGYPHLWNTPLHCDGLILISTMVRPIMICNPAMGEIVTLPYGSYDFRYVSRAALGFDPRTKKYKVARFFYELDNGSGYLVCKFEVLTLGTDVWRPTIAYPPCAIAKRTPVHVQGFTYWMIDMAWISPEQPHAFLRFSLADEEFSLVPYPPSNYKPARFVQSETELCCACFCERKRELEIWSLSVGRENPEWTRRCNVVIGSDLVLSDGISWPMRPPKVVLHGRTLILTGEQTVYQYDMHTTRMEKIASDIHDIRYYDQRFSNKRVVLHLTNYVESLVGITDL